ncbi:DNA-formamidopyrimidine glycosylase [Plesiocystis pacifica SIR-1]|uniref:DNA-(apurinic or apyrimidinic site) lyase n=1 Tax=Plesiocystis pacifica SIR-1 TaxID=391625 RepID=A6GEY5_9BACT|nr:DNA-formamidopyrimidine glycosylase family protein [Plesiocystis pacifica]EDM75577.1 DNA-formamidopyrimidine glycosylase [Plesiocystis pacifica SIR-1]
MPEGDSLHATAITLRAVLAGRELTGCELNWSGRRGVALAHGEAWRVPGRRVESVEARGKNLLIRCAPHPEAVGAVEAGGRAALALTIWSHMGMTGSWHTYRPRERWALPPRDAPIVLRTAERVVPCFRPHALELLGPRGVLRHRVLARLGPDLLAAKPDLDEALARMRALVEAEPGVELGDAVMRQRVVAGIGNEYKSELLFLEGLDPFAPLAALDEAARRSLLERAAALMRANLASGAPRRTRFALDDPHGRGWVYERSGRPCRVCGELVCMRRQGALARSTYFCPNCQGR